MSDGGADWQRKGEWNWTENVHVWHSERDERRSRIHVDISVHFSDWWPWEENFSHFLLSFYSNSQTILSSNGLTMWYQLCYAVLELILGEEHKLTPQVVNRWGRMAVIVSWFSVVMNILMAVAAFGESSSTSKPGDRKWNCVFQLCSVCISWHQSSVVWICRKFECSSILSISLSTLIHNIWI